MSLVSHFKPGPSLLGDMTTERQYQKYGTLNHLATDKGAIQVLCNAVGGGGGVSAFPEKSVTKVYSSTLLA